MTRKEIRNFSAEAKERLAYYVYALADPAHSDDPNQGIFYIGMGQNDRCFSHAASLRQSGEKPLDEDEHKLNKIKEIQDAGHEVKIFIVAHGLYRDEAQRIEAILIPRFGETNKQAGHRQDSFWLPVKEIEEQYYRPLKREDFTLLSQGLVVASLSKQTREVLKEHDGALSLTKATLGDWYVSEAKSRQVRCILGVKGKLVVSVIKVEQKDGVARFDRVAGTDPTKIDRSCFYGERDFALESALRGRSVAQGDKLITRSTGHGGRFFPPL